MKKLSLCLGYFDSVHAGHRELIHRCAEYAAKHDALCAVYTFREDRIGLFDSLYCFDDRQKLLREAGADLVMSDIFNEEIKNLSGKAFLDRLTSRSDICAFFCGYDYTFGKDAKCDARILADHATQKGICCHIMPCYEIGGEKVSTSRIKALLIGGNVAKANELLVKPYFMRGKVVHGRAVGRKFGIPTANICHDGFLPREGVYKARVFIEGISESYTAVVNMGGKPTFNENSVTIEAMLIDFEGDLYDKNIEIDFIDYLRPIYKFESGEKLGEQIQKDIKEALCSE